MPQDAFESSDESEESGEGEVDSGEEGQTFVRLVYELLLSQFLHLPSLFSPLSLSPSLSDPVTVQVICGH